MVIDYIVAERDADRAVNIVKQRAAPNGEVEPVRPVSDEVVLRYRLNRGQSIRRHAPRYRWRHCSSDTSNSPRQRRAIPDDDSKMWLVPNGFLGVRIWVFAAYGLCPEIAVLPGER